MVLEYVSELVIKKKIICVISCVVLAGLISIGLGFVVYRSWIVMIMGYGLIFSAVYVADFLCEVKTLYGWGNKANHRVATDLAEELLILGGLVYTMCIFIIEIVDWSTVWPGPLTYMKQLLYILGLAIIMTIAITIYMWLIIEVNDPDGPHDHEDHYYVWFSFEDRNKVSKIKKIAI